MKLKLVLFAFAFMALTVNTTYASFPVEQKSAQTTSTVTMQENISKPQLKEDVKKELTSPAVVKGGDKSQVTALLLCIFLGGIGVHRYYLGYIWQGIVQTLTFGGLGVWALIDLIRIITGSLQPKDGSYSKTL